VQRKILLIRLCFYITATFTFLCIGCRKNDSNFLNESLQIRSISPASGKYGIMDTIRGGGFGDAADKIELFFNNVAAEIISVTDTLIIASVPQKAGSGFVTIHKNNEHVIGPPFHYIYTVTVSTLAGTGLPGYKDGPGAEAYFYYPRGIAMDAQENIYVSDFGNNRIRKISTDGNVSTIAGNGIKSYRDGPALDAEFYALNGLAMDKDNLYIADATRLRKFSFSNNIVNIIAGNENTGKTDGTGTDAEFSLIYGVTTDTHGNIFVTDVRNNRIRKINPNRVVTTIAGSESGYADGYGSNALFSLPGQLIADQQSNIYVADAGNFRIRQMNAAGNVYTLAGNGNFGYKDGRFFNAEFMFPIGITIDDKKNVYVCGEEDVIRKIDANEDVTTIAGSGVRGYLDGPGEIAMFNQPIYIITDKNGTLYVTDESNHCIRKVVIE
jgi:serine/threonine-protein kinase